MLTNDPQYQALYEIRAVALSKIEKMEKQIKKIKERIATEEKLIKIVESKMKEESK